MNAFYFNTFLYFYRYAEVTNETHKQLGKLLKLFQVSKGNTRYLCQREKGDLKPFYKKQKGSTINKVSKLMKR